MTISSASPIIAHTLAQGFDLGRRPTEGRGGTSSQTCDGMLNNRQQSAPPQIPDFKQQAENLPAPQPIPLPSVSAQKNPTDSNPQEWQSLKARKQDRLQDRTRDRARDLDQELGRRKRYQVSTAPPTRAQLFQLYSDSEFNLEMERRYRAQMDTPNEFFLSPSPMDRFSVRQNNTLGPLWYQSQRDGNKEDENKKKGFMSIKRRQGCSSAGVKA